MDDNFFMRAALTEAQAAFDEDEIPVGAVVVYNDKIVARAHNLTQRLNDVTAHAEMQAITSAAANSGGKYLKDCTLYVTLEPCTMCAGALAWSQIGKIVYGATDTKRGFLMYENAIKISTTTLSLLHPKTKLVGGVLENECAEILKVFFEQKRK